MSLFDSAFMAVEIIEKGYVADPQDPGGETRYGISKRAYPQLDIKTLTLVQAKGIYLTDYWNKHQCDALPWHQALLVFDTVVNGGAAETWLTSFRGYGKDDFIEFFLAERMLYLAGLRGWSRYGRGWSRRLFVMARLAANGPGV